MCLGIMETKRSVGNYEELKRKGKEKLGTAKARRPVELRGKTQAGRSKERPGKAREAKRAKESLREVIKNGARARKRGATKIDA